MSGEVSTIQSLKAVDAWIDVINANINGGVRTAFKSSRLKFSGSNVDVQRAGGSTSLPLQFPEPGLTTANTVIDFTQGAVTASTENSHLAIQGEGFFVLIDPGSVNADGTLAAPTANTRLYLTRDGEFRTNQNGLLVHSSGYLLTTAGFSSATQYNYNTGNFGTATLIRCVYNNLDVTTNATVATRAIRLSDYIGATSSSIIPGTAILADGVTALGGPGCRAMFSLPGGKQSLTYTPLGSTVYDWGYQASGAFNPAITTAFPTNTVLTKSLEASNASMTQSVPELSLAQKLFSALTKVLQTKQTNVDGVLNLVR